jgi:hypothetical protein
MKYKIIQVCASCDEPLNQESREQEQCTFCNYGWAEERWDSSYRPINKLFKSVEEKDE